MMLNRLKAAKAAYTPNRSTVAIVQNHPATQAAGAVLGAAANAAGTLASATVVPATIAALSYAQRAVDPDGRFDADIDAIVAVARNGAGRVVSGMAAIQTALTVDINDPAVSGHIDEPCDIPHVERFDDDDLLVFPERQPDVLGTYANRQATPYAKSDDGLEDVSLCTTKEVQQNQKGRVTVADGFGGDGYEMVDEEDGIDEQTDHFYNERLAESTVSTFSNQRRDSSGTDLQIPMENLTLAEVEFRAEMERMALTTQWQSQETGERGREMEVQRQRAKYSRDIPVDNNTIYDTTAVEQTTEVSSPIDIPGAGIDLSAGDSQEDISFHPAPLKSAPTPIPAPVTTATALDDISDPEDEIPSVAKTTAETMSASFIRDKAKLAAEKKAAEKNAAPAKARKLQATVKDEEEEEECLSEETLGVMLWDELVAAQEQKPLEN